MNSYLTESLQHGVHLFYTFYIKKKIVNICIHSIQNYFSDCNSASYTLSFGWRGSFKGDFGKCNPPISKEIDSWNFLVHNVDLGEKENIFEHNQLLGIEIWILNIRIKSNYEN